MSEETQRIYHRVEEIVKGGIPFGSSDRPSDNPLSERLRNSKAIGTLYRYDCKEMTIYELTLLMDPYFINHMAEHMQPVANGQSLEDIDPNVAQEAEGLVLLCSARRFDVHVTEHRTRPFFIPTKSYQISGQLPHDSFTSAVVEKKGLVYPVSEEGVDELIRSVQSAVEMHTKKLEDFARFKENGQFSFIG